MRRAASGRVDEARAGALSNPDLAPVPPASRTWNLWHFAALWVAMSVCIPTYMLSAGMVASGLTWQQSLFAMVGFWATLAAGVATALAGLADPLPRFLFDGAWFSAGIVSFVLYAALARGRA